MREINAERIQVSVYERNGHDFIIKCGHGYMRTEKRK